MVHYALYIPLIAFHTFLNCIYVDYFLFLTMFPLCSSWYPPYVRKQSLLCHRCSNNIFSENEGNRQSKCSDIVWCMLQVQSTVGSKSEWSNPALGVQWCANWDRSGKSTRWRHWVWGEGKKEDESLFQVKETTARKVQKQDIWNCMEVHRICHMYSPRTYSVHMLTGRAWAHMPKTDSQSVLGQVKTGVLL